MVPAQTFCLSWRSSNGGGQEDHRHAGVGRKDEANRGCPSLRRAHLFLSLPERHFRASSLVRSIGARDTDSPYSFGGEEGEKKRRDFFVAVPIRGSTFITPRTTTSPAVSPNDSSALTAAPVPPPGFGYFSFTSFWRLAALFRSTPVALSSVCRRRPTGPEHGTRSLWFAKSESRSRAPCATGPATCPSDD
ncbi:hypothetical protein MRX96_025647 [Rhipicephalus microplus]